jgi:glycogen operon protein
LLDIGLSNYWGYNPIAWNAPETRYASRVQKPEGHEFGNARLEFRAMVDALHAAGIEVLLDVVYNHSGETDEWGPTLSLRGIDNATYYHLDPQDLRKYTNWTGCGNCLNVAHPMVLRMVMDSLRHWVTEFGVDGFRFDLAPVMARVGWAQGGNFNPRSAWLAAMAQDPVLRQCTMVAEPWDIGSGGYRLGEFPDHWLEWNDRFRDVQRAFWLRQEGARGELATRLSGSTDFFNLRKRAPHSSVNFVTAHDGFTLTDLVSYRDRRNWANGEENRDGHGHNLSVNFGVEGDSHDALVGELRMRCKRVLLANVVLSLGTPMLLAGDEMGHTQRGNNNAYCQDNQTTWLHWEAMDEDLLKYTQQLLMLRKECAALQSQFWWHTDANDQGTVALWFNPNGCAITEHDWTDSNLRAFMLTLEQGALYVLLCNAGEQSVEFTLPTGMWQRRLDTSEPNFSRQPFANTVSLAAQSLWVLEFSEN